MFLGYSMSWDGRLFPKEYKSMVWQKCPSKTSLLRRIRAHELNIIYIKASKLGCIHPRHASDEALWNIESVSDEALR